MKRRAFLSMLGLAPVVAAMPVLAALPRLENPKEIVKSGLPMDEANIGHITGGGIRSKDGSVVFDFSKGTLTMSVATIEM